MNTDYTVFSPTGFDVAPPPIPIPAPAPVPVPAPVAPVVPPAARPSWVAILLCLAMLGMGAVNVAAYYQLHNQTVVPHPSPSPPPVPPAPVVNNEVLHASLVYNTTSDLLATTAIRSDSNLANKLKSLNCEWYVLDADAAKSVYLDTKMGAQKTPAIIIQKDSDPTHPFVYPMPSTSDGVIALVNKMRGKS